VLDPDVVVRADRGALPAGASIEVRGAPAVAEQALAYARLAGSGAFRSPVFPTPSPMRQDAEPSSRAAHGVSPIQSVPTLNGTIPVMSPTTSLVARNASWRRQSRARDLLRNDDASVLVGRDEATNFCGQPSGQSMPALEAITAATTRPSPAPTRRSRTVPDSMTSRARRSRSSPARPQGLLPPCASVHVERSLRQGDEGPLPVRRVPSRVKSCQAVGWRQRDPWSHSWSEMGSTDAVWLHRAGPGVSIVAGRGHSPRGKRLS
jgi:hypothetical protein